jgi:hypothetical protein
MRIKVDLQELKNTFKRMENQLLFVLSLALNKTATSIRTAIYSKMQGVFDRPTPFTLRSLSQRNSTKQNLTATVFFREFAGKGTPAAKYLGPQVYGGERGPKRFEKALGHAKYPLPEGMFAMPASGARLDPYGNISRGQITTILSRLKVGNVSARSTSRRSTRKAIREDYFIGRPGGGRLPFGVWQKASFAFGSAVKPVMIFGQQPGYSMRLPFHAMAQNVFDQEFNGHVSAAVAYAVETSR